MEYRVRYGRSHLFETIPLLVEYHLVNYSILQGGSVGSTYEDSMLRIFYILCSLFNLCKLVCLFGFFAAALTIARITQKPVNLY